MLTCAGKPRNTTSCPDVRKGRATTMRSLLVDDSPVILQVLKNFLHKFSDCDLAQNGQAGIDAFTRSLDDQNRYDLVCLDLQMPEIDGLQLIGLIRSQEQERQLVSRCKILVITATGEAEAIREIRAKGADGYLLKPISEQKLLDTLANLGLVGSE